MDIPWFLLVPSIRFPASSMAASQDSEFRSNNVTANCDSIGRIPLKPEAANLQDRQKLSRQCAPAYFHTPKARRSAHKLSSSAPNVAIHIFCNGQPARSDNHSNHRQIFRSHAEETPPTKLRPMRHAITLGSCTVRDNVTTSVRPAKDRIARPDSC